MGCLLQSPLASCLGCGLPLRWNVCAKGGRGNRDDVGEDGPAQCSRAHSLAGDEIFTHGNEGQRIPTRAMPPAVPQAFGNVNIEIVASAAPMLRMRARELSLGFLLEAGAVVLSNRYQIRLPSNGSAPVGGLGWRWELEEPVKIAGVVAYPAFVYNLDELAIFKIDRPWRTQHPRKVPKSIQRPAALLPSHDEGMREPRRELLDGVMLRGRSDEVGLLQEPMPIQDPRHYGQ